MTFHGITGNSIFLSPCNYGLVRFPIMGLEMGFEKTQRVDSRAALFADRRALFGLAHGNFLEHGGE